MILMIPMILHGATDSYMDSPWIRLVPSRAFCQL